MDESVEGGRAGSIRFAHRAGNYRKGESKICELIFSCGMVQNCGFMQIGRKGDSKMIYYSS